MRIVSLTNGLNKYYSNNVKYIELNISKAEFICSTARNNNNSQSTIDTVTITSKSGGIEQYFY